MFLGILKFGECWKTEYPSSLFCGLGLICFLVPRDFFRFSSHPPTQTNSKLHGDLESVGDDQPHGCAATSIQLIFIYILDTLECPTHKEKTKYYCRNCRCLCCASCHRYGSHKNHSCFQVHEAEEKERKALVKLQTQVEQRGAKIIKARGEVQQTIEGVKKNTIEVKDIARRYYRELRAAIDQAETILMEDINKRSDVKLKALNEQLR